MNEASGSSSSAASHSEVSIPPPKPDVYAPPPYSECGSDIPIGSGEQDSLLVEPPSYEEVQLLKAQEAAGGGDLPLPPYSSVSFDNDANYRLDIVRCQLNFFWLISISYFKFF